MAEVPFPVAPAPVQFLFDHFMLVGTLFMCANLLIVRYRLREQIAAGALTAAEADRFCLVAAAVFVGVGVTFELTSLVTGVSIICALQLPLLHPANLPCHALVFLLWGGFLYWVWKRGGDQRLAVIAPALMNGPLRGARFTARQVRVAVTALVLVSGAGHFASRLVLPFPGKPLTLLCRKAA